MFCGTQKDARTHCCFDCYLGYNRKGSTDASAANHRYYVIKVGVELNFWSEQECEP